MIGTKSPESLQMRVLSQWTSLDLAKLDSTYLEVLLEAVYIGEGRNLS